MYPNLVKVTHSLASQPFGTVTNFHITQREFNGWAGLSPLAGDVERFCGMGIDPSQSLLVSSGWI